MSDYNDNIPNHCLPLSGLGGDHTIYRAVGKTPDVTSENCKSHAELGKRCNLNCCNAWGLSVWLSENDVNHARGLFKFLARQYVVRGMIKENQGCLKHTPSNPQPNHYTFWKKTSETILLNSQVTHSPAKGNRS